MDVTKSSYAEGKFLDFEREDKIGTAQLEVFPYEGAKQKICYETAEYSAVCPYSGLPDYGVLRIEYIPARSIVELKSLKYYIVSFRNVGIFQEPATSRIYGDLMALLQPQWLCVTTIYNTRGGIDSTCVVDSDKQ